jgi:hypothetical protein
LTFLISGFISLLLEILKLSTFVSSFGSETFITFFALVAFWEIFFDTFFVFFVTTFLAFLILSLVTFFVLLTFFGVTFFFHFFFRFCFKDFL